MTAVRVTIQEQRGWSSVTAAGLHVLVRWDDAAPLDGRRVGVVGTGSTAVQIVSALVDRVARLSLFQRTAQWIMPQQNPPYSEAEQAEFRRNPALLRHIHDELSRLFAENFSNAVVDAESPQMKLIEEACRAGRRWYHMGDSTPSSSLAEFKRRFGAGEEHHTVYLLERWPLTAAEQLAKSAVKRVLRFRD